MGAICHWGLGVDHGAWYDVAQALHNRRLFLPADWRPQEWLLLRIIQQMPLRAPEPTVERFLAVDNVRVQLRCVRVYSDIFV